MEIWCARDALKKEPTTQIEINGDDIAIISGKKESIKQMSNNIYKIFQFKYLR